MQLTQQFGFGVVLVDTVNLDFHIDRGRGHEPFTLSTAAEEERRTILEWLYRHPGIDRDDLVQLAWESAVYEVTTQAISDTSIGGVSGAAATEILKIQANDGEKVTLELLEANRRYKLRKVQGLGTFLINTEELVYPLGGQPDWFSWQNNQGWVQVKEMDELDLHLVNNVIAGQPDRFFG